MYLLIIFLPLFNYLLNLIFGSCVFGQGSFFLTIFNLFITLILVCISYYEIIFCGSLVLVDLGNWVTFISFPFTLKWEFLFDSLTISMCLIILVISFMVHLYSVSYMASDVDISRFLSYLSLFTFFMLLLVTAKNFIVMFLGWEGVGVASYLLISFWNTRELAAKNALKAMLINKIGDICLLISFGFIFFLFNTFDYYVIFELLQNKILNSTLKTQNYSEGVNYFFNLLPIAENFGNMVTYEESILFWISLFLFLGAMGKSAQIGFHTWLPDAMEGPTPVSALIHAATMVTAGVFLVIRCSPLLIFCEPVANFVVVVGSFTAFFAGTIALVQFDMKKIIAYSTCSQLGYMFFSCGLLHFDVALFHLVNHAFFKALLFLSSGVLIHALADEQDLRKFGGLLKILPLTYVMVLIGSIALTGIPFFSGYFSKDIILELSIGSLSFVGNFSYFFGLIGCTLTAFYSLRLLLYIFFSVPNSKILTFSAHEGDFKLLLPLIILAIFSIYWGFFAQDIYIGVGSDTFFNTFITDLSIIDSELGFVKNIKYFLFKNMPLLFAVFGFLLNVMVNPISNILEDVLFCYMWVRWENWKLLSIYYPLFAFKYYLFNFLYNRWYFDLAFRELSQTLLYWVLTLYLWCDRGIVEAWPFSITKSLSKSKRATDLMQSGYLYVYVYIMLASVVMWLSILSSSVVISFF